MCMIDNAFGLEFWEEKSWLKSLKGSRYTDNNEKLHSLFEYIISTISSMLFSHMWTLKYTC